MMGHPTWLTGVETHINETESHAYLKHCHQIIKAIEIMTGTLQAAFKLNKLE